MDDEERSTEEEEVYSAEATVEEATGAVWSRRKVNLEFEQREGRIGLPFDSFEAAA